MNVYQLIHNLYHLLCSGGNFEYYKKGKITEDRKMLAIMGQDTIFIYLLEKI